MDGSLVAVKNNNNKDSNRMSNLTMSRRKLELLTIAMRFNKKANMKYNKISILQMKQ